MTRTSHRLPRPVFDAILELEDSVRAERELLATLGHSPDMTPAAYVAVVMEVGRRRDILAALILGEDTAHTINDQVFSVSA